MNLDPNNTLYLIDGEITMLRELQYTWVNLYSQEETICLLGLMERGLTHEEIYRRFDYEYPGRRFRNVRIKIDAIIKRGWVK